MNLEVPLPLQMLPFPVYPLSQVHKKDPLMFEQLEFSWQSWSDREHSSMSKSIRSKIFEQDFKQTYSYWLLKISNRHTVAIVDGKIQIRIRLFRLLRIMINSLTVANSSISSMPVVTSAQKRSINVRAVWVLMTVVKKYRTFINI